MINMFSCTEKWYIKNLTYYKCPMGKQKNELAIIYFTFYNKA